MDSLKVDEDILKSRLRSVTTMNTFYHEMQQEIAVLGQQIHAKDCSIADLKARLGKYESICIKTDGGETLVGPSKTLVESLCREIRVLKQKLKDSEADGAQKLKSNEVEIQELQQLLKDRDQELEYLRLRPEHKKEQEIHRLRSALVQGERAQATRAVLCSSLAEEADQLRTQLGATVKVCQELMKHLEKERNRTGTQMAEQKPRANETTVSTELACGNAHICKLQEENQQLQKRVEYVESLNAKWQKYDLSREEYVRGLCQRLKECNGLAKPAVNPQIPAAAPVRGGGALSGSPSIYQQEIARLNGLLEEKIKECERLGQEKENNSHRDQEHIQMLQQQARGYIEDFNSERADRERAQDKILSLQEEVNRLRLQLHSQCPREPSSTCRVHLSHRSTTALHRRVESAEPLPRSSNDRTVTTQASGQAAQGSGELQCPYCFALYDDTHTAEYLNHCEECARL